MPEDLITVVFFTVIRDAVSKFFLTELQIYIIISIHETGAGDIPYLGERLPSMHEAQHLDTKEKRKRKESWNLDVCM